MMLPLLLLIATVNGLTPEQVMASVPPVDRTSVELCAEVKYELDIAVEMEMLTKEDAESIVDRCYESFVE